MSRRVRLAQLDKPYFEWLLGNLLSMKSGNLVVENLRVAHAPEWSKVAFGFSQKVTRLFKVAHGASSPPEAPIPERG